MSTKLYNYIALPILIGIIILFFVLGFGDALGLDADVGAGLLSILPGLFLVLISMLFMIGLGGQLLAVVGFAGMGISLAVLLQEMYDVGIIVESMLGGATIAQFEIIVVIMGVLLGMVAFIGGKK